MKTNIDLNSHILVNDECELLNNFIVTVEKVIKETPPISYFCLNYKNERYRQINISKIITTNGITLSHFASEGMSNYYHYKNNNNILYAIKEFISSDSLERRLQYCIENI